jgi:transcription termination factor Rho
MDHLESNRTGVLELQPNGQGYLRDPARHYRVHADDVFVGAHWLNRQKLKPGHLVRGLVEPRESNGRPTLTSLLEIEGQAAETFTNGRHFDHLTAIDPHEPIRLETGTEPITMRVLDLLTPVGKGQRGLIVAPPRTGKTILLQQIANAAARNHPELRLFVLLVDERPEEVTEMRRTIQGEVIASSSDQSSAEHIRLAQLTIERTKRLAEAGGQVLLLVDSLTRLARAYNKSTSTGRTMSGGVDIRALEVPKRLFGAARAFEEGGSLTVLATCLIETNSRMDDVIFQEFKGTGNLEIVLDRRLADRRVWPAIDLFQSGTRKEERLLAAETLSKVTLLRRTLSSLKPVEAMESLVKHLGRYPSNQAFLERLGQAGPSR